jgi:hypothetical protein
VGLVVQLGWGIDREERENKMEEREFVRRPHKEEMENGGEKESDGGRRK